MTPDIKGRIHSFQSLGTVDGPGVRFVVFFQGCPLRCACCHNPDTWDFQAGEIYTARQVVDKAARFKSYFGKKGGITLSGGEPICQPQFASEIFKLAHLQGINTCLDTSGCVLNSDVKDLLENTDRVLLDLKYSSNELYEKHVGCRLDNVLSFLDYLNQKNIPVTIRQVIFPNINDGMENLDFIKSVKAKYSCIDKIELLPFKKICQVKYDNLKIDFPFKNVESPDNNKMIKLNEYLNK